MDKREEALIWWNNLTEERKSFYSGIRVYNSLTGREVENIFLALLKPIPSTELQKEVTGCTDCPFLNDGAGLEYKPYCQHPNGNSDNITWQVGEKERWRTTFNTPDWCPLKKEPITISFKQ